MKKINRFKTERTLTSLSLFLFLISSCGANIFESAAKDSEPLDAATRALEKEDPQEAINILLSELGSDVEDLVRNTQDSTLSASLYSLVAGKDDYQKYLSVLSAAYAQSGGLDPIDMFLKMSEDGGSSSNNSTQHVSSLFPIMPEATEANIIAVDKALYILQAIPSELFTDADTFKMGILLTGSFTLKLKALDRNGDGTISLEETLDMNDTSASGILGALAYAISSLDSYGASQESNQALDVMNSKLENIQTDIHASDGESNAEKLAEYLSRS